VSVRKRLNRKEDGSFFLQGIEPQLRTITYLPAEALEETAALRLRAGDYAGIYTEREGLDVSHVGIIVRAEGVPMIRHASSDAGAVIDQEAAGYLKGRPGLVVLRPRGV
jgi:phosphoenolpyruvate-protein kinase (PTS system EI component)